MEYKKVEVCNNETAIVNYWPEIKLIEIRWIKKVALDSELYRQPFLKALEFGKTNSVELFLSDISNQGVVPVSEKNWFKNTVLQESIKLGLKSAAVITSGNVFKTYYLNAVIKVGNIFDLPIKTFTNKEKAINWLLKNK